MLVAGMFIENFDAVQMEDRSVVNDGMQTEHQSVGVTTEQELGGSEGDDTGARAVRQGQEGVFRRGRNKEIGRCVETRCSPARHCRHNPAHALGAQVDALGVIAPEIGNRQQQVRRRKVAGTGGSSR